MKKKTEAKPSKLWHQAKQINLHIYISSHKRKVNGKIIENIEQRRDAIKMWVKDAIYTLQWLVRNKTNENQTYTLKHSKKMQREEEEATWENDERKQQQRVTWTRPATNE